MNFENILSLSELPSYLNCGKDVIKIDDGGVFNFYQGDNLENLKENIKKQPEDWKYRTKNITYTLNSYGYRTTEFDKISWKDSIVVFGCSNVFGISIDDTETLPYYLSNFSGRNVVNMGIPASSNELMLYNSLMLKKKYGAPYCVIIIWSGYERSTYFIDNHVSHIGAWNYKEDSKKLFEDYLYEKLQYSSVNSVIKNNYIINCAKELWNNTIYYDCTFFGDTSKLFEVDWLPSFITDSRDLSHPGSESMKKNAEFINNKIRLIEMNKIADKPIENKIDDKPIEMIKIIDKPIKKLI